MHWYLRHAQTNQVVGADGVVTVEPAGLLGTRALTPSRTCRLTSAPFDRNRDQFCEDKLCIIYCISKWCLLIQISQSAIDPV